MLYLVGLFLHPVGMQNIVDYTANPVGMQNIVYYTTNHRTIESGLFNRYQNLIEFLGIPEKTCLICTGTPMNTCCTCCRFWQS